MFNPLAKYEKYKKYLYLDRPKHMNEIYEDVEKFLNQKTLAETQEIVIGALKKKAEQKASSTAFLADLQAREKAWAAASRCYSADRERSQINEEADESSDSSEVDYSVDLSDIKSENESIYWKENRGNVEAVDILIGNEKLFDHEFLNEFKNNLAMFERRVMAPHTVLSEYSRSGSHTGGRRRRGKSKSRRSAAGQN